ncbi:MAG: AAA family ATPase [Clostridia bacterium]|nr:AAA family ATPase [Clostridia bacterium]
MYIKNLNISAFGTLRDREIDLTHGLNIIEGDNESGKSAAAMFIKFMLYGLSGKSTGGELTERRRYVNWSTGTAGGSMTVADGEKEYRIERLLTVSQTEDGGKTRETVRESIRMIDTATNTVILKGENPGEKLFGVPENIFMNTVFVRQIDGARISSTGVLASIENLLFSANETVGTKKAIERLDDERRRILHKNGGGGLLHDLRTERSEAVAMLRDAETRSGTLTASEEDFESAKAQCEALQEKIRSQTLICRYGALNLIRRRFDTATAARKKIAETEAKIAEAEAAGQNADYLARLKDTHRRLTSLGEMTENLKAARTEAHAQWKNAYQTANNIHIDTEDATHEAASLRGRMRGMTAAGIVLLLLAAAAGAGAWLLYKMLHPQYTAAIIGTAVLAALAFLFFILGGRAKRKLTDHLIEWDAASVKDIPAAILRKYGDTADPEKLKEEEQRLDEAYENTRRQRRDLAAEAIELAGRYLADVPCSSAGADTGDSDSAWIDSAFAALTAATEETEKHCTFADSLRSEADALRGRLSVLEEQLSTEDETAVREAFNKNMQTPEGRIASGIDAPRLEAARAALEQLKEEYSAAEKRMHSLETGIAAARAVAISPAEIADKITALDGEIEELAKRHEAYCLAIDMLKSASESMRAGVLPRVVSEACASANQFAGGSFDAIGVDESLSMNFTRGGQTHEVEYLSEGTKDIAYVSLRRALTGVLFDGVRPPLIYDESFARVDETRLERILALLAADEGIGAQSILLSCHKREANIARKIGNVNIVQL